MRRRLQLAATAAAVGRRRRRRTCDRSASTSCTTCRRSASTCRTTSRSTSSTRCTQPVSMQPWMAMWRRPYRRAAVAVPQGPRRHQPLRGAAGSCARNDDVAYPNLMFHFLPIAIRYDGSSPAGGHGYQVHIGPMYSDARGSVRITSTDPTRQAGDPVQLPVDRRRTGASGSRRSASPATSSASRRWRRSTAARSHPGRRSRPTSRSSTGSHATPRPRCTRRARAGWAAPTTTRSSTR